MHAYNNYIYFKKFQILRRRWETHIVRSGRKGEQGRPKEVVESSRDMEEQERESTYVANTCWCDRISELPQSFEGIFRH